MGEAEAEEVEEEKESAEFVIPEGEPSGPKAGEIIIQRLEAKDEDELTTVERDILAAKARTSKFSTDGVEETFEVSEAHKRKLREQRFGPMPKRGRVSLSGEEKISEVDEEEQKKRDARASRFGQPEAPNVEE